MPAAIDALFVSYFEDLDRHHNDGLAAALPPDPVQARVFASDPAVESDLSLPARHARQSVGIDGHSYDFRRWLSWVRYGSTAEYRRFCAFTPNHLSGSYYRSLLAQRGHAVQHVNCADRLVLEDCARRFDPRVVLLSTTFLNETPIVRAAIEACRRSFPGALLVLGGLVLVEYERSMPRARFLRLLAAWGADAYVVSPEGEDAVLALLAAGGADLDGLELPHTYVRRGGAVVLSTERCGRSVPFEEGYVRWSLLDPDSLYHTVHTRTARSCAFSCAFCSYPATQGPLVLASPETVRAELEELQRVGSVRSLIFTDDTFNVPPPRFKALCRVLADFDFEWYSFFRAQYADRELTDLMRASGCRGVFLGIESIDDVVLKNMHKSATHASYRRGVAALKQAGILLHANFIVGYPGDTEENCRRTVDFVDEFDVEFFTASPFYCSPGTPVWERRAEFGIEGQYQGWRHATMDFPRADRLTRDMLGAARRSVFMSELTANGFWTQLLFYANGFDAEELRALTRAYNRFLGTDRPAAALRATPEVREAERILARR
ncbi:MAG TPA: radical SAM protein, partial [Planctomycetota bacterium]|nr:radical SAM protein [Planctomycetota bacterium]